MGANPWQTHMISERTRFFPTSTCGDRVIRRTCPQLFLRPKLDARPSRINCDAFYAPSRERVATTMVSMPVRKVGWMTGANFGL